MGPVSDSGRGGGAPRRTRPSLSAEDGPDLEALRELLIGPERARLEELERKPLLRDLEPGDVGPVLARAVELSEEGELSTSLTAPVEGAIARSAGRDPDVLARAFAPVMGPALRRALAVAIASPAAWIPWALGLGLLVVVAIVVVREQSAREEREALWRDLARAVDAEPGLVVVAIDERGGERVVRGLRDPAARNPEEAIAELGLGDRIDLELLRFEWEPYHSLEEPFVVGRVRELLDPPETVALDLSGGVLSLEGRAPATWIRRARELASSVTGISGLDTGELVDEDLSECWKLQERLDGQLVMFAVESVEIDLGLADWSDLEDDFARLDASAWRAGVAAIVELAPEIVPVERGKGLGLARTRAVKAKLDELPRRAVLVRTLAEEKIVGHLNGGPKGKLPRVVLRVTLPGADRPRAEDED